MATPPREQQSPAPDPPSDELRLTRLEEHAAFTEHTVDQLSAEIASVNKRLAELGKKMTGLEERLGKMLEQPDADDAAG